MIIFLRGLPGSGKTTIAKLLSQRLSWDIISVDLYKMELLNKYPKMNFLTEIVPKSYQMTLEGLQNKKGDLIIEEIFKNKDFVHELLNFCKEKDIEHKWFKITRDMSDIIETNKKRKRFIKNKPEVLSLIKTQLDEIKILNEIEIKNTSVDTSVEKILDLIKIS